jgi:RHS repeat-associated protein
MKAKINIKPLACFRKIALIGIVFSAFLTADSAFALNVPPSTATIKANSLTPTSPVFLGTAECIIETEIITATGTHFKDARVDDIIMLGVDQNYKFVPAGYNQPTGVHLNIERWDAQGASMSSIDTWLYVNSAPAGGSAIPFIDKDVINLKDAYKIKITMYEITIKGVTSNELPLNLYVKAIINVERYYDFASIADNNPLNFITADFLNTDGDPAGTNDEIKLSWEFLNSTLIEPEEYQLEWTFVNDYDAYAGTNFTYNAPANLTYDFKHNSTRITTKEPSYKISLVFDHGYLLYRVRAIGKDMNNPSKSIVGIWSSDQAPPANQPGESGIVATYPFFKPVLPHEGNKNWQEATTFAEEGKKKEVINYFDGSLRSRQTVTKVNTDKNSIVGQTIYDYQGRPAISVLPSPVLFPQTGTPENAASLQYYYKFNSNGANEYTEADFEKGGGICAAAADPMSSASGASNYYSPSNPNQKEFQAYVPDAKGFPFSQTEYQPDNSGKIKRQGGVGNQFQLGTSTHPTEYYYENPLQPELDRLFGSEVGDFSHYKKNLVIDANGQPSVSYLDQENRTIATALVGQAPLTMEPLDNANTNVVSLTAELLNSQTNTKDNQKESIEFSISKTVLSATNIKLDYSLLSYDLSKNCTIEGVATQICFSCVYDLEITVTDQCNNVIYPDQSQPIPKIIGKFFPTASIDPGIPSESYGDGKSIVFQCISPAKVTEGSHDEIHLPARGTYNIVKKLTVNKQGKEFYMTEYFKQENNPCIKTKNDFIEEAIGRLDTMVCYPVTCVECANLLGSKSDWLANNKGTALAYDLLLEECMEPCKPFSWCEGNYKTMMLDVSLKGQYGMFDNNTGGVPGTHYSASSYALSVYNTANYLPKYPISNWKNPKITVNGIDYNFYLDKNGIRVKVPIEFNNGFLPEVDNPLVNPTTGVGVYYDQATSEYYTYPENLKNLEDFVTVWDKNFAKSLVQYHPEYCYYEACKRYGEKAPGADWTSDKFDDMIIKATTFSQAETHIDPEQIDYLVPHASITNPNTNNAHHNYLLFWFDPANPSKPHRDPFLDNPVARGLMDKELNKYGNSNLTMLAYAAYLSRCGTIYLPQASMPGAASCTAFGSDINAANPPYPTGFNDTIRNHEWNLFKNLYLSAKRKVQNEMGHNFVAKEIELNHYSSAGCRTFNYCIGDKSYNPFLYSRYSTTVSDPMFFRNMLYLRPFWTWGFTGFYHSPYFDSRQPCSYATTQDYMLMSKVFSDESKLPNTNPDDILNNVQVQIFYQSGQSPMAFAFQNFLNGLASHGLLVPPVTGIDLQYVPEFTRAMYSMVNSNTVPATYNNPKWNVTYNTPTQITFTITPSTPSPGTSVDLFMNSFFSATNSWANVKGIGALQYTTANGIFSEFTATAYVVNGTTITMVPITGKTTFSLKPVAFNYICEANDNAKDISNLWNYISGTSASGINSTVNIASLSTVNPAIFLTNNIQNLLGSSNLNAYEWRQVTGSIPPVYEIALSNNPNKKLVIKFATGGLFTGLAYLKNIKGNSQNLFTVIGLDANMNNPLGPNASDNILSGEVYIEENGVKSGVGMGKCKLPTPMACTGNPYQLREDLEDLLRESLIMPAYQANGSSINLVSKLNFTNLLKSYFPQGVTATSTIETTGTISNDKLVQLDFKDATGSSFCNFKLWNRYQDQLFFNQIKALGPLTPYDLPSSGGVRYKFFMIADFEVVTNGTPSIKTDTIFGESCLPLKYCDPCKPLPKKSCTDCVDVIEFSALPATICKDAIFNISFLPKKNNVITTCLSDNGIVAHYDYGDGTNYATLGNPPEYSTPDPFHAYLRTGIYNIKVSFKPSNPNNWATCTPDDYFFTITAVEEGCQNQRIANININDPFSGETKSDKLEAGKLLEVQPELNLQKEYMQYAEAIDKYNERVKQLGYGKAMPVMADSLFATKHFARKIDKYASYLEKFPQKDKNPVDLKATIPNSAPGYQQRLCGSQLEPSEVPLDIGPCEELYESYLLAYSLFVENHLELPCELPPFYDDVIIFRHLGFCNGPCSFQVFQEYIDLLSTTTSCTVELPDRNRCKCEDDYYTFRSKLKAYNCYILNNNLFVNANPRFLDEDIYPTYEDFLAAGRCACLESYINYLNTYMNPATTSLVPAVSIDNYGHGCTYQSPCYEAYNGLFLNYNTFYNANSSLASNNPLKYIGVPSLTQLSDWAMAQNDYCNCFTEYSNFLKSFINGTANHQVNWSTLPYSKQFSISNTCNAHYGVPCPPVPPQYSVPEAPVPPARNLCVLNMINIAVNNAENEYNIYINKLKRDMENQYVQHCMSPIESLQLEYSIQEFNYTLYYYDQAGNLVKTVPPEGVNVLPISNDDDPVEAKKINDAIDSDRKDNTHIFTTAHTMSTTYEYNSLNQLVKQNLPDHDPMDIWEFTLPNGLDSRLNATSTQFLESGKGYLTGYITLNGNLERGLLYTSDDAGQSWKKVNDMTAVNLRKVFMVPGNSGIGYAVGEGGTVLKTFNNGQDWDLQTSVIKLNTDKRFNDLYFVDDLKGVIVGEDGTVLYTTDGGVNFQVTNYVANGNQLTTSNVSSITAANGNFYIVANDNNGHGHVYYSDVNLSPNWTEQFQFTANDLSTSYSASATDKWIAGKDGMLLHLLNTQLEVIPTGHNFAFKSVYFKNTNLGVAILKSGPLNTAGTDRLGEIWKTADGGHTWTKLSANNEYFSDFFFYKTGMAYAVGNSGIVRSLGIFTTTAGAFNFVMANVNFFNQTDNLTTLYLEEDNSGSTSKVKGWVAGDAGNIYYSADLSVQFPGWTAASTVNPAVSGCCAVIPSSLALPKFKKMFIKRNASGMDNGLLLTEDLKVYSLKSAMPASVMQYDFTPIDASTDFTDVIYDNSLTFYALQNQATQSTIKSISAVTNNLDITATSFSQIGSPFGNGKQKSLSFISTAILSVGDKGAGFSMSLPSYNVSPISLQLTNQEFNDVQFGNTTVGPQIVGKGGKHLELKGTNWEYRITGVSENLNAIKVNNSGTAVIAGDNGGLWKTDLLNSDPYVNIPVFPTNKLNDVFLKADKAYVAGRNGTLLYINDINSVSTNPPVFAAVTTAENFYGLSEKPTNKGVYAVGTHSTIYNFVQTTGTKIKSVNPPRLNDVSFRDPLMGYVVGAHGTLLNTTTGGQSWTKVNTQRRQINSVWTAQNITGVTMVNQYGAVGPYSHYSALVVGEFGYLAYIYLNTENIRTWNASAPLLNKIRRGKSPINYILGEGGTAYTVSDNGFPLTMPSLVGSSASINMHDIHIFSNGSAMLVGNTSGGNPFINFLDNTLSNPAWNAVSSTLGGGALSNVILNAVYFHDDRTGYIAGASGTKAFLVRCSLPDNISNQTTNINWVDNNAVQNPAWMNGSVINCMDFATRYNGFIGVIGSNTAAPNECRLLHDETGLFSTKFWYDKVGRMVLSQNSKQFFKEPFKTYSYTKYDKRGRIVEVGEKTENDAGIAHSFSSIFGDDVNGSFNPNVINNTKLLDWLDYDKDLTQKQVTSTYYDEQQLFLNTSVLEQENLRNRVASVTYRDIQGLVNDYDNASHYSYDIHGNVKVLLQENVRTGVSNQQYKRMDYDYDLISGNVNEVHYQIGQADAFHHHYEYDADNRITSVYTSSYPDPKWLGTQEASLWDKDAKYFYYAHGPLARVEVGNNQVQGLDYAYTLQGWMKGVNSNRVIVNNGDINTWFSNDIGKDAVDPMFYNSNPSGGINPNQDFAADVFGYTLGYNNDDYQPINYVDYWSNIHTRFEAASGSGDYNTLNNQAELFNGNIRNMVTTITAPEVMEAYPLAMAYRYDQLNRLKKARGFDNYINSNYFDNNLEHTAPGGGSSTNFDPMARYLNEFTYDRNGNILTQNRYNNNCQPFDQLSYKYLQDPAGTKNLRNRLYHVSDIIADADATDDIDDQGGVIVDLNNQLVESANNYTYDKIGNLETDKKEDIELIEWTVSGKVKTIWHTNASSKPNLRFDYDAMGNRIAKHVFTGGTGGIPEDEIRDTYYVRDAQGNVISAYTKEWDRVAQVLTYKLKEQDIYGSSRIGMAMPETEMIGTVVPTGETYQHVLGAKNYEFSNHLGNVLAVVSDKKIPVDINTDGFTDYFKADLIKSTDYSPFGAPLDGRDFGGSNNYVIQLNRLPVSGDVLSLVINGSTYDLVDLNYSNMSNFVYYTWKKMVQVNGLHGTYNQSNNTVTITDWNPSINELIFTADLVSILNTPDYRYGFNGMEKDDEVKGGGNSYTTLHRIYDPRLGRWLSVDPEADEYPDESPYAAMENNPISETDPDGDCPWCIAFIKGAVQEYATQVIMNVAEGKSIGDALTDVDGGEILKSAVIDGLTLGVGSLVSKAQTAVKVVKAADKIVDAEKAAVKVNKVAKTTEKVSKVEKNVVKAEAKTQAAAKKIHGNSSASPKPTQKYTIKDQNGKPYHGVGDVDGKRANKSLERLSKENPDKKFSITDQKNHPNRKDALIDEHRGINQDKGGAKSPNNYNKIESPGKKLDK